MQQTASEQLFQIEAMRGRLEQHKQSAPFAQKQATSRLELQLHEATTKYHSLEQIITDKDLEVIYSLTMLLHDYLINFISFHCKIMRIY